jgi:hypothetical protein
MATIEWESRGLTLTGGSTSWDGHPRWFSGDCSVTRRGEQEWRAHLALDSGSVDGSGPTPESAMADCDREAEESARWLVKEWAPWLVLP